MKAKMFICCRVLAVTALVLGISAAIFKTTIPVAQSVESLGMFSVPRWTVHYRAPNIEQIETLLEEQGIPLRNAEEAEEAIAAFRKAWAERNPTTPNPEKYRELLERERQGKTASLPAMVTDSTFKSLVALVEFPNSDTFDWCGSPVTKEGPLHNEIPAPGARDNNTVWYEDTTPALYDELYFGVGPDAGVTVNHPNLGAVDLHGHTMANYYIEQSEGAFTPTGTIYPKWLQAAHAEGWYGADSCTGSNHNVRADDLVREVVEAVKADNPGFAWQEYDGNADGIIDNFTVIHAGMGQESGGGQQGDFSIWSHASAINMPGGYLACSAGSTGCPDRNIYVREYSMDPENIDIGVISEEFGHAAFGLPDIYSTDYQASPSNWTIFEAGSWNGILGGMQPAPFPLIFRYLVGWANPVELDYTTGLTFKTVGQLSLRPQGTEQGIKINLPDQVIETPNPLDTGKAWWSDKGDFLNNTIAHEFNLAGTSSPVFSFNSAWSLEEDWDGGYVEVSTDGGATWTALPDMDGTLTQSSLNGNNPDLNWVLTGEGTEVLRFDLTAYAGSLVSVRLRYATDMAVTWAGWWADDFSLDDGATNLFNDDVEGTSTWTNDYWVIVPLTRTYPIYYMAEWRNNSGFDGGLQYPYLTVYNNDETTEWEVDRCPYTLPGMLLWLRNGAYDFDYTLSDSWYDPPSTGPKHALLVIDSHYWPMTWDTFQYSSGAKLRITSRCQPADATFTLQETTPFTLRLGYNPANGQPVPVPLETKTFDPLPAVSQFSDALGYYPGLLLKPPSSLYFWHAEASAVVPALGDYTTRITDLDRTPLTGLYGTDLGWAVLGSGNPGDSGVQYGLHLAVIDQAEDGTWGVIKVWNDENNFLQYVPVLTR